MSRKTIIRLTVGLFFLVAIAAVGSRVLKMGDTFKTLLSLDPGYLVPVLAMALLYYLLKALRWHYYLGVAGIRVPLARSMAAYLAGQWFTFTPAGELMRVYLLGAADRFALVAPTIVVQVVVDFASLALLATLLVAVYPALAPVVLPVTLPLLITLAMLATPPLRRFASTWRLARRLARGRAKNVTGQLARLLAPWPVTAGLLMGVPTVAAGALTLHISGVALGIAEWRLVPVSGVYAMTQLVGGISPLPQGLGVAEGSGTVLLGYLGIDPEQALAAMLLSRGAVLGFSVLLGLVAFLVLRLTVPELAHVPVGGVRDTGDADDSDGDEDADGAGEADSANDQDRAQAAVSTPGKPVTRTGPEPVGAGEVLRGAAQTPQTSR
jgi:glycosyltransferase 2 family protein